MMTVDAVVDDIATLCLRKRDYA